MKPRSVHPRSSPMIRTTFGGPCASAGPAAPRSESSAKTRRGPRGRREDTGPSENEEVGCGSLRQSFWQTESDNPRLDLSIEPRPTPHRLEQALVEGLHLVTLRVRWPRFAAECLQHARVLVVRDVEREGQARHEAFLLRRELPEERGPLLGAQRVKRATTSIARELVECGEPLEHDPRERRVLRRGVDDRADEPDLSGA